MKKNNFTLVKLFALILFLAPYLLLNSGCNKNNASPEIQEGHDILQNSKLQEFLKINNDAAQRSAYNLLQPHEKYALWFDHLKKFENVNTLNTEQKRVVKDVLQFLTPSFFSQNSKLSTENFDILQYKMKTMFPRDKAILIFSSFKTILNQIKTNSSAVTNRQTSVKCTCNQGDDWCYWGSSCGYGCGGTSGSGCGTLWEYGCNGSCH